MQTCVLSLKPGYGACHLCTYDLECNPTEKTRKSKQTTLHLSKHKRASRSECGQTQELKTALCIMRRVIFC